MENLIVLVNRSKISFYPCKNCPTNFVDIPNESVQDLSVTNKSVLLGEVSQFIEKRKIPKSKVFMILGSDVIFIKEIQLKDPTNLQIQKEVEEFRYEVPEEPFEIITKNYLKGETLIMESVPINFYIPIIEVLEKNGMSVEKIASEKNLESHNIKADEKLQHLDISELLKLDLVYYENLNKKLTSSQKRKLKLFKIPFKGNLRKVFKAFLVLILFVSVFGGLAAAGYYYYVQSLSNDKEVLRPVVKQVPEK